MLLISIAVKSQTTFTVTNTNDWGLGSLRAISDSVSFGDTIRFSPSLITSGSDTIFLISGDIDFGNVGVVIKGLYNSNDTLYISGNNNSRIFSFEQANRIILDSVVLIDGYTSNNGGAIYLYNCTDTLFINNSLIFNNTASSSYTSYGHGGGIYTRSWATLPTILTNSIIAGNTSTGYGGGISSSPSTADSSYIKLSNSIIKDNIANYGGGISSDVPAGKSVIDLYNSEVHNNTAINSGGGVYSHANGISIVNVNGSFISNNSANSLGGGIYSITDYSYYCKSYINIVSSTINGNNSSRGSGICSVSIPNSSSYSDGLSSVNVLNSSISNNFSNSANGNGYGGGIYSYCNTYYGYSNVSESDVSITNSSISDNYNNSQGGGIFARSYHNNVSISNSSIYNNSSSDGGGVFTGSGYLTQINILESTIYNNHASSSGGGVCSKVGNGSSTIDITNSTISYNSANSDGSGLYTDYNIGTSAIYLKSSIIAENDSSNNQIYNSSIPTITSFGYNLFGDSPTGASSMDSINVTSTQLDLQSFSLYGGTTPTLIPSSVSIAVDAGTPNDTTDAQNAPIVGTRDVGAAEGCFALPTYITITECDSFIIPNSYTAYYQSGLYTDTVVTNCGADSIITYDLTILNSTQVIDTVVACDSYTWIDGITYTADNDTATVVFTSSNGCDSIILLDLVINNTLYTIDSISSCDSYTWINGITYTTNNNTATDTLISQHGCDSIITLNLTILQPTYGVDSITACENYTWIDGITYTANNNTATDTISNSHGCDSIITLNLTILNSSSSIETVTACDSYTFNGITYTTSNSTATKTLVNSVGCDSVITLNLTILYSNSYTDIITSCKPVTWIDGNTYSSSNNTATYVLTNKLGCDSIVNLDLTINSVSDLSTNTNLNTITANNSTGIFQWLNCDSNYTAIIGETNSSFTATSNGNYAVEITENGCTDTSTCVPITQVSANELNSSNILNVYPNPNDGILSISLSQPISHLEITLINIKGQIVYRNTFSNELLIEIDINQPSGVYFLIFNTDQQIFTRRIIVR